MINCDKFLQFFHQDKCHGSTSISCHSKDFTGLWAKYWAQVPHAWHICRMATCIPGQNVACLALRIPLSGPCCARWIFFCILGRLDQDSIVCRYFLSEAPVWLKFSRHCWPIRRPSSNHHLVKSFQYTIVHGLSLQSLKRIRCQCCRSPLHCYQLKSENIPFLGPRLCGFRLLCPGHRVS